MIIQQNKFNNKENENYLEDFLKERIIFDENCTVKISSREKMLNEVVSIIKFVESIQDVCKEDLPYIIPESKKMLDYKINPSFKKHIQHYSPLLNKINFETVQNYHSEHSEAFYKAYSPIWHWRHTHIDFPNVPLSKQYVNLQGKMVSKADVINDFYRILLSEINSKEYKDRIKWRKARADNQYRSADKFLRKILHNYARVVVIRIDLSYRTTFINEVDIDTIKKHLSRLLKGLSGRKEFQNIIGYIWKLEYGVEKGYHYHLIVFMDGSKVKKDAHYAELIGKYWSENITNEKGYYYNCNRSKHKYKFLGIGMLNYYDKIMIDNLLICIRYLTKTSQYIMETGLDGKKIRVFGRSEISLSSTLKTTSLGRPRSKSSALFVI